MAIALYYAAHNQDPLNPRQIYGVPQADLTQEQYDALPFYLKQAVDESDLYLKSKPPEKKVKAAERAAAKVEAAQQAAEEEA